MICDSRVSWSVCKWENHTACRHTGFLKKICYYGHQWDFIGCNATYSDIPQYGVLDCLLMGGTTCMHMVQWFEMLFLLFLKICYYGCHCMQVYWPSGLKCCFCYFLKICYYGCHCMQEYWPRGFKCCLCYFKKKKENRERDVAPW